MTVDFYKKTVLITGGTGSWGYALTKKLLDTHVKQIIIFSRGELGQVNMQRHFDDDKLKFIIGDIRDKDAINNAMADVDIVFHLAALKHIPICENQPWESIQTNVIGAKNVIDACLHNKVQVAVLSSTDKACAPFNFYGCCKSITEKLFIKANKVGNTKFVCVRAGNVIGSNGSIVPFFKKLIIAGEPVPITDILMTRYYMDISTAIELLFVAMSRCIGGEIFVTKMPACKIVDLVNAIYKIYQDEDISPPNVKLKFKIIGIRQGEKLHEMLVSEHEMSFTVEVDKFMVILPMDGSLDDDYAQYDRLTAPYCSNDNLLTQEQLSELLKNSDVL